MNAANLATEEDFNNENSSNSGVEEDILITKNDWNTRKWGNLYFLFPHLSGFNIVDKIASITKSTKYMTKNDSSMSFFGKVKQKPLRYLNFILSGDILISYFLEL